MNRLGAIVLAVYLTIQADVFHVTFSPSPDNYAILVVIDAVKGTRPYSAHQEVPIEDATTTSMDFPRRALPRGTYDVTAILLQWPEGSKAPYEVESASTTITTP